MLLRLLKGKQPEKQAPSNASVIRKKLITLHQTQENLFLSCNQESITRQIKDLDFQRNFILLNDDVLKEQLLVNCSYLGKGLTFKSQYVDNEQQLPYISIPSDVNLQQRREAFRVDINRHSGYFVSIDGDKIKPCQGRIIDISISGIQATFKLEFVEKLEIGDYIQHCTVNLGECLTFDCQLEIKRFVNNDNGDFVCMGSQYLDLSRISEYAIGQFIAKYQRQNQLTAIRG